MNRIIVLLFCWVVFGSFSLLKNNGDNKTKKHENVIDENFINLFCHFINNDHLKADSLLLRIDKSNQSVNKNSFNYLRFVYLRLFYNQIKGGPLEENIYLNLTKEDNNDLVDLILAEYHIANRKALDKSNLSLIEGKTNQNLPHFIKAYAYYLIGKNAVLINKTDLAIPFFNKAISYSLRSIDKLMISRSFMEMGKCYEYLGLYEQAYIHYQKGLKAAEKYNEGYQEAKSYNLLGMLQMELGSFNLSMDYFKKSYRKADKIHANRLSAIIQTNIGTILMENSQALKAIEYFNKALIKLYSQNDKATIVKCHKQLGRAYLFNKDYDLARDNFKLSLGYAKESNDEQQLAKIYYYMAEMYLEMDQLPSAKEAVEKAIYLHEKNTNELALNKSYRLKAKIYETSKNFKLAYLFLNKYSEKRDSLQAKETKKFIAELNSLYKAEQKEKLILKQQKEIEEKTVEQIIKDQQLENTLLRNRLMLFLLILLILLFGFIIMIVNFRTKKEKLKRTQRESDLKQTLLRSQMNPHFIFNAMSVIQGYIYDNDTSKSSTFLVNFSKLMRLILENSEKEFIALSTELEILERYLSVQKLRFEERFDYTIENKSNIDSEAIAIPPMLMQPFIENAIEHGQLHTKENGLIKIYFVMEKDLIVFTIEDNGVGVDSSNKLKKKKQHKSMAIAITKNRIDLMNQKYKCFAELDISDLNTSSGKTGTRIVIKTPYQKLK